MSDPVTNVEIEDVLSSIRRLVSSDERPAKARDKVIPEFREPDRLVLTPSLRVDDAPRADFESNRQDAPDEAAIDDTDDWTENFDIVNVVDAAMQENPPAVQAEDDEFEAEMTAVDDPATKVEDAVDDTAPPSRADELKARVAELEEVVARQSDQWEPDGASAEANSGGHVSPLPWEDCVTDEDNEEDASATPQNAEPQADFDDTSNSRPQDAVSPEPAEDYIPANVAAEDCPQDGSSNVTTSASDSESQSGGPRSHADFLDANDDFLDEDALRDLVADIVRQELQGALGERITRNVRKLVRREIHRALDSQELQ
ncbi:hypothetical protein [Roseovarius sp. Pro17]|uniref:hypothetical protein n=1 Tax=Roseovarius sp. Pro17 TaxID=3108175 RepID=UPI002D76EE82|nr:hypothetical protein [Roseovarius sp. Pro17]